MDRQLRRYSISWIVIGAVAGLVTVPTLVALTTVLVRDLRDVAFEDHPLATFAVTGTAGLVIGAALALRALRSSRHVMIVFGAVSGAVVGAAAVGSLSLWIEVTGPDWPSGMAAFVTGAIFGGVLGGVAGGVLASARVASPTVG